MIKKRFPTFLDYFGVIFVNYEYKLTIEEIKEQLLFQEPLISDEEAFLRHLARKYRDE